jgi:two-component system sensor histidine kinase MprB
LRFDNSTIELEVSSGARSVLRGETEEEIENQNIENEHLRVLNVPLIGGGVVQLGRSLNEADESLNHTRNILVIIAIAAIGLAAGIGLIVTRLAAEPLRRVGRAMDDVASDSDLSVRLNEPGNDELSGLASRFNTMLDALGASRRKQQQLVEDASHELRTPLTSIRTNLETLTLDSDLKDEQRQVIGDVVEQVSELAELSANIVELAHGVSPTADFEPLALNDLVSDCVMRAERASGDRVTFELDIEPCTVRGDRDRLRSAVDNLLSNAVKWTPDLGRVLVRVRDGSVTVCDDGPGIDVADREFVFDRFYRSAAAREKPGAGLGLAIVRAVADEHGGSAAVIDAPAGWSGACVRIELS